MRKYTGTLILSAIAVLGIILFLFYGITERNAGYFIPLRAVKITAIILVSYCIGYSSVVFQTITSNRILTPSVMGLDSLYMFIQTVIVFFFQSKALVQMTGGFNYILSILLMVGMSLLFNKLMFRGSDRNIYFLVLAGIVAGQFFSGLADFMQVLLDPNEFNVLQGKMFASFSNVNRSLLTASIIIVILCTLFSLKDLRQLDVLSLGPDNAVNLGVDYKRLVRRTMITVAILISVSTALIGPVTFLGIILVSLSRQISKTYRHSSLVTNAVLIGVIFLIYGLFIVEKVFSMGTTLSVIINFVGGIYFIFYMIKESKR